MVIAYNASMPRSGSELIQVILSQHPNVVTSSTSPLLDYVFNSAGNLNSEEAKSQPYEERERYFYSFAKGGMHAYAEEYCKHKEDAQLYIDKNRGWMFGYHFLNQLYPNPKFICMVRDLAEIVASMEKMHKRSLNIFNTISTLTERVDTWCSEAPVGLALKRVVDSINQRFDNVLYVKYENFCQAPQEVCNTICNFLDLPNYTFDFNNITKTVNEHQDVYSMSRDIHTINPVLHEATTDADSILGSDIAANVRRYGAQYQNTFGYSVPE